MHPEQNILFSKILLTAFPAGDGYFQLGLQHLELCLHHQIQLLPLPEAGKSFSPAWKLVPPLGDTVAGMCDLPVLWEGFFGKNQELLMSRSSSLVLCQEGLSCLWGFFFFFGSCGIQGAGWINLHQGGAGGRCGIRD